MSRVCEAVGYLHAQQVVHYDLKPGNIMLREDGSIALIDFGMAHRIVKGRFTFGGSTPAIASSDYVAPEQIQRVRGKPSVDIYALGAMLYELLTGHPPFEGDDPFVLASARQIGDPRAPRALNPSISTQTEEIVLRALRRNPAERYASAAELRADLDHPLDVQVSGLSERLVEVTRWRTRLRMMRFIVLATITPLFIMAASFRLLWWYLARKH
jgi:serine/threonine protein kinase